MQGSRWASPHARRLGCCKPDAAVLHHHAARRVDAQLLQTASHKGQGSACCCGLGRRAGQEASPRRARGYAKHGEGARLSRCRRSPARTTPASSTHAHTHMEEANELKD